MPCVLVIDDNSRDRRLARDVLEDEGFQVEEAASGADALKALYALRPDLVVLDVIMPTMDGWTVCQRVREMSDVPIIMLTSLDRDEEMAHGLDLGADDFVSKPLSPRALAARVRAVLRRANPSAPQSGSGPAASVPARGEFRYDDGILSIDVARHEVRLRGAPVALTPTEFRLLLTLARTPGRVHNYAGLLSDVWGPEYIGDVDFLRVYVWRLRKKLEADPENPTWIQTERGFGYRFAGQRRGATSRAASSS